MVALDLLPGLDRVSRLPWPELYQRLVAMNQWPPQTPELARECAYWHGFWDLEWFAQYFFPEYCRYPFSRMHHDLFTLESPPLERGRHVVIAAPRANAKTTIMLTIKTVHALVYGYEPFIVVVAQSRPEAIDRVKQILEILRSNERLIEIFGVLAPKMTSSGDFIALNGVRVKAISRGQSIRGINHQGNRPSLIILDDVETLEEVQNPDQRLKNLNWFRQDVMPVGQADGSSNIIVIGTCLHDESLLSWLLEQPGWIRRRYRAVESFATNKALWDQWEAILTDLDDVDRERHADQFFADHQEAMLEGTEVLWPEVEPYDRLMKLLVFNGRLAFFAEKQNEPFDPSQQIFDITRARYFTYNPATQALTVLQSNRTVALAQMTAIYAFHDPGVGEGDLGDYAAIVVAAKDVNGYFYILDAWVERDTVEGQINAAVRLYEKWGFEALFLEGNGFQGIIKDSYDRRFLNYPNPPRIGRVHHHENKKLRIAGLEPLFNQGRLIFNETLDQTLMDQLSRFPGASHDDGPDALQGVIHKLLPRSVVMEARQAAQPEGRRPHTLRRNAKRR